MYPLDDDSDDKTKKIYDGHWLYEFVYYWLEINSLAKMGKNLDNITFLFFKIVIFQTSANFNFNCNLSVFSFSKTFNDSY